MKFLFGDSHVREIHDALVYEPAGWKILGIGGASAAGILNVDSKTQARKFFNELWEPGDDVIIMLGECDVVDLLPVVDDSIDKGIMRLNSFVSDLVASGSHVTLCTTIPHRVDFNLYKVNPSSLRASLERWNLALGPSLDIYTPLQGPDGYLPACDCLHTGTAGERHLNKNGYLRVWDIIRTTC